MSFSSQKQKKLDLIEEILGDLRAFKEQGMFENTYAVEENIRFFKATRSFWDYLRWLLFETPELDRTRLLELSDFHLHSGEWERILQKELLEVEQWKFPDLLRPLRLELLAQLRGLTDSKRYLVLVNLGAGAMEIERQVINALRAVHSPQRVIFLGIDESSASLEAARANLSGLSVAIQEVTDPHNRLLDDLKRVPYGEQYVVYLLRASTFQLNRYFGEQPVDLLYHSKFKHHVPHHLKASLDAFIERVSRRAIEYDNLNGWFMRYVPIRSQWYQPVLLNGSILSCLRAPTRKELRAVRAPNWTVRFFIDSYVRVYVSGVNS